MICLFLFVICAMLSDCRFEQMDRGRKGQEKDGEESEMKGFDIFINMVPCFECSIAVKWLVKMGLSFYVYVAVDEIFYSTLLGLNDFFISSF